MALTISKLFTFNHFQEFSFKGSAVYLLLKREVKTLAMATRFPGVDSELQKILDANMDHVSARRQARHVFKDIQLGIDHILFKTQCDGLKIKESYEVNSRGVEIFYKSWLPGTPRPKAAVFYCHGYGDTCTFFFEGIARKLACAGYGVFAMDYPGFGLSEGLHCYIPSFDLLVDDVIEIYSKIKGQRIQLKHQRMDDLGGGGGGAILRGENPEIHSLPSFLFGQSMGGAVALKMHLKQPKAWDGAILVAPMCKIADDMVPPMLLKQILIGIANILPKQKLVPQKNLAEAAFRDLKKREMTAYNVIAYKDKPRLWTAVEMLKTTQEIEQRLKEVCLPLLILHGEADIVTDPSVSKAFYEKSSSSDKKLKLYKDAYHSLLEGEPDEMIIQVFSDIIVWLDDHSLKHSSSSPK
ncbi:hypothetical protein TSUD_167250 [Trifolium subterraneum]|nr:hypothetical protein TSUD_167250 [Trifolium subterraneum]